VRTLSSEAITERTIVFLRRGNIVTTGVYQQLVVVVYSPGNTCEYEAHAVSGVTRNASLTGSEPTTLTSIHKRRAIYFRAIDEQYSNLFRQRRCV